MKMHAYLAFPGNCEEALNFYRGILGGEIGQINYYDGSPMESPESKGKIMHTQYSFGDGNMLMAADSVGHAVPDQSNVTLSIGLTDVDETGRIYDAMSAGGTVLMPLQDRFFE